MFALLKTREETPDDHQVVGQNPQGHLAIDGEGLAVVKRRAKASLDHGEDRLYLPALAVGLLGETPVELPSVVAGHGVGPSVAATSAAMSRGDNTPYPEFVSAELVDAFALVAGVGKQGVEPVA